MANEDLAEVVRGQWVNKSEVAAALEGREASIRVVDQFPAGTEVRLVECTPGARTVPEGRATATAKAGKDTVVEFSRGVKVGHYYFAVGEIEQDGGKFVRSVKVRGKFHGDDEDIRPPAAFVSSEPFPGPDLEDEAPQKPRKKAQTSKGASELKDTAKKGSSDAQAVEKAERAGQKQTPKIKR